MFDDFHIISVPLQKNEVRGVENLSKFGDYLINQK
jgi:anion-transporting  ArsA/GET3 family ATPase